MKKVCGTCLYGIDAEAGQSSINVRCAFDDGWRPDRTEGCVEWKETTGGLSKKDIMDLASRQASSKSQLDKGTLDMTRKADILIVTAAKVESQAVIDVFGNATGKAARPERIAERIYHDLGEINGMRVFLALSEMGAGGLGASQQAVEKAINLINPSAVVMVGIAFGVDEQNQAIGDILVSQRLWLYNLQRVGANKIIPRGDKPHASTRLLDHLKGADLYQKEFKVRFGLVLTGEKLVDNVDYRDQLKAFEPEAIGGEMEGAGLYVACHESKVDWILVKAICDWADGRKDEEKKQRQKLAAMNAAKFVLGALQMAPIIQDDSPSLKPIAVEAPKSRVIYCSRCGAAAGSKSECSVGFTSHDFRGFSNDNVFCPRCGTKAGSKSECSVGFTSHDFKGFSNDNVFCSRCGTKAGFKSECSVGFTSHDFKGF